MKIEQPNSGLNFRILKFKQVCFISCSIVACYKFMCALCTFELVMIAIAILTVLYYFLPSLFSFEIFLVVYSKRILHKYIVNKYTWNKKLLPDIRSFRNVFRNTANSIENSKIKIETKSRKKYYLLKEGKKHIDVTYIVHIEFQWRWKCTR